MELRQLRVFISVVSERSFTRAAEKLYLTQSAVSTSVQALEREIGVMLIDRTVQPIALTTAGQEFLEYAKQTLQAAETAVQVARQELGGTVTVGFISSRRVGVPTMPAMITSFRKSFPSVTVVARHVGGSMREAEHVRDGHLDCAIVSLAGTVVSGVRTKPLWEEPIVFVCRRSHPLADREVVGLADLRRHPMVSLPSTWGVTLTVDAWLREHDASLQIDHVVNDANALLDFVVEGEGSVLLPVSFVPDDPGCVAIPIDPEPVFVTELAVPLHRTASPAAAAFIAWVQERARRHTASS